MNELSIGKRFETFVIQQPQVPFVARSVWTLVNWIRGDHLDVNRNVHELQCLQDQKNMNTIVTLTTNPRRIRNLLTRLLPLLPLAQIHLNLPLKYKNEETYPIECIEELELYGVSIFWFPLDSGPSMKLIPTLERCLGTHSLVLCIDDDVILGADMIPTQKQFFQAEGPCIASRQVHSMPGNSKIPQILGVNVIGIHSQLITESFLQDLKLMNELDACRQHDDIALCLTLYKYKLPIKQSPSFFHKLHSDSFTTDSLWHRDPHNLKDQRCLQACLHTIKESLQ